MLTMYAAKIGRTRKPLLSLDHEPTTPAFERIRAAVERERIADEARARDLIRLEMATAQSHRVARRKMRRPINLVAQRPTNRTRNGKVFG